MVPTVLLPPAMPSTVQVAAPPPGTVAVNCWVRVSVIAAVVGERLMVTLETVSVAEAGVLLPPAPLQVNEYVVFALTAPVFCAAGAERAGPAAGRRAGRRMWRCSSSRSTSTSLPARSPRGTRRASRTGRHLPWPSRVRSCRRDLHKSARRSNSWTRAGAAAAARRQGAAPSAGGGAGGRVGRGPGQRRRPARVDRLARCIEGCGGQRRALRGRTTTRRRRPTAPTQPPKRRAK